MKITPDERNNKNKTLKNELHEVFHNVEINIPLLELICKVQVYARFLKDLCIKKKRLEEHEVFRIEGHVSSMIQHNMPPKRKDPGSFTIKCQIGDTHLKGALMDLGASVNVMPQSLYKRPVEHWCLATYSHCTYLCGWKQTKTGGSCGRCASKS